MKTRATIILGAALALGSALAAGPTAAVSNLYQLRCAKCHGADGSGKGKLSDLLDPKPASFIDAAWQAKRSDAQIIDAITNGHAAKQKISKKMPFFGTRFSQVEIEALVSVVRGFKSSTPTAKL
jgi:mono/diheme cytochrome c family protein